MITSLFGLTSEKTTESEKNNNDDQDALKPQLQTQRQDTAQQHAGTARASGAPANLDQLSRVAQQLFNDDNLEVSKVRPFFWSLVETYLDRFQVYPFDVVKALFSYLESRDYPQHEMRELVSKLEACYQRQHGEAIRNTDEQSRPGEARDKQQPVSVAAQTTQAVDAAYADDEPYADDELSALRSSLKLAAMVAEQDEQP